MGRSRRSRLAKKRFAAARSTSIAQSTSAARSTSVPRSTSDARSSATARSTSAGPSTSATRSPGAAWYTVGASSAPHREVAPLFKDNVGPLVDGMRALALTPTTSNNSSTSGGGGRCLFSKVRVGKVEDKMVPTEAEPEVESEAASTLKLECGNCTQVVGGVENIRPFVGHVTNHYNELTEDPALRSAMAEKLDRWTRGGCIGKFEFDSGTEKAKMEKQAKRQEKKAMQAETRKKNQTKKKTS